RPFLRERGGEIPPRHSPLCEDQRQALLSLAGCRSRGRGFGDGGHREAGQGCGAEVSEAHHEEIWPPAQRRHRRAFLLSRGDERDRQRRSPGGWASAQQSGGKLASAVSATRASHAAVPKREDAPEIQLSSCSGAQALQPGTSSRQPRSLQTEAPDRARRVAGTHGLMTAWVWASYVTHRRPDIDLTMPSRTSARIGYRHVQNGGTARSRRPPMRTGAILRASPVSSSVSTATPVNVAGPVAGVNRLMGIPVVKRRRGSSFCIPTIEL